jgi:hypothetical protein
VGIAFQIYFRNDAADLGNVGIYSFSDASFVARDIPPEQEGRCIVTINGLTSRLPMASLVDDILSAVFACNSEAVSVPNLRSLMSADVPRAAAVTKDYLAESIVARTVDDVVRSHKAFIQSRFAAVTYDEQAPHCASDLG